MFENNKEEMTSEWYRIKELYPKAAAAYSAWVYKTYGVANTDVFLIGDLNTRTLFDFFDSNEIHVDILYECYGGGWFAWTLVDKNDLRLAEIECDQNDTGYLPKSRAEAEFAAFEKAFEILDGFLTKSN